MKLPQENLPRNRSSSGRPGRTRRWIASLAVLISAIQAGRAETTWIEDSFADFRDGSFLDGGSNLYVSASGRIQIINRWDLNGDGLVDVVLPSGHGHTEKESTYVYINHDGDVDARRRIELPGGGSSAGLILDLNGDGMNDLVVANEADSHVKKVDAWIFWGSREGFSPANRTRLPAHFARAVVAGDFNGDSRPDLAFACAWSEAGDDESVKTGVSLVYLNSASGFDPAVRIALPLDGDSARSLGAGDLDRDGIDELVVATPRRIHIFRGGKDAFARDTATYRFDAPGAVACLADMDGDASLDLVVGGGGAVAVHLNRAGRIQEAATQTLKVTDPSGLCAVDLDRDGDTDLAVAVRASEGGATWTDSLVILSKDGSLDAQSAIRLPTLGASGVNAGDLNADGFPELVFGNLNVTNQRRLYSYVYWNRAGTFRFGDHSQLPTEGAVGNAVGDVDNDGDLDVVYFNSEGGFRDGAAETHLYWGTGSRRLGARPDVVIPTHQIFGHGHADLDDDGAVDLVLTRENFISDVKHEQSGISIHWGSGGGLSGTSEITAESSYGGVRFADINRDGYLDILAGGANTDPADPSIRGIPIYWGSTSGFAHGNRSIIPTGLERVRGPLLADLDRDGWLDVAAQLKPGTFSLWHGGAGDFSKATPEVIDLGRPDALMYIQAADLNRDGWLDLVLPQRGPPDGTEVSSLILYGSSNGFQGARREVLPSYVPYQNSIADLDRDGWLDVALTSYGGEVSGNRPSLVYWGSAGGFLQRPRTELPTYGSSGSVALDFDQDGWLDLFFANHRRSGSTDTPMPHRHRIESMLYWGGPEGYSPERRLDIPGYGPSGLNLRDPGNAYDRGLYEDYVSSPFECPAGEKLAALEWVATTPHGTRVAMQVRFAADPARLDQAEWVGPQGANTWWDAPAGVRGLSGGRWVQYRARLQSPNAAATPYLTQVMLKFR